jgi:hypothetical protein
MLVAQRTGSAFMLVAQRKGSALMLGNHAQALPACSTLVSSSREEVVTSSLSFEARRAK